MVGCKVEKTTKVSEMERLHLRRDAHLHSTPRRRMVKLWPRKDCPASSWSSSLPRLRNTRG